MLSPAKGPVCAVLPMKKAVLLLGWINAAVLMALANSSQKRKSTLLDWTVDAAAPGPRDPSLGGVPVEEAEAAEAAELLLLFGSVGDVLL